MMENFIKKIDEADKNIKLAYQKKEKVIDDFLEEIKPICECFHSIWKNDEKLFKKNLEEIANKYNYKFMYGYGNRYNNDKTFFLINSIVKAMDENISIVDLNKIPKNVEEK